MSATVKAFWLSKKGNTEAEYEDAFRYDVGKSETLDLRFAVADGATEASFSKLWANQLVRAFVRRKMSVPIVMEELAPLQKLWSRIIGRRQLPWFAAEKAAMGAFSAIIGLEVFKSPPEQNGKLKWKATAAGDSCLVQVREHSIIAAHPLSHSESFNNSPDLICSKQEFNNENNELISYAEGDIGTGDSFYLMTDALACWFFRQHEGGGRPWIDFENLDSPDLLITFADLISGLREAKEIRNDDVTLLKVNITE